MFVSIGKSVFFFTLSNEILLCSDNLLKKYGKAQSNVEELKKMGAAIMHEVDATKMKFRDDLRTRKFDRVIFNFPHAGFKGKEDHPQLIKYVVLYYFPVFTEA